MDAVATDDGPDQPGAPARAVIAADKLARLLGIPASVLSFLEARVPQVRSIAEDGVRVYRARDAVLVAGLAELLYDEGLPLREVDAMMGSGDREAIAARGRERLRDAIPSAGGKGAPRRARPIPPDAVVRPGGTAGGSDAAAAARRLAGAHTSGEVAEVLAELMECVRLLEAARRHRP